MYLKGVGVVSDQSLAMEWLKRSAAQGYEGAQNALARIGPEIEKKLP
jgi:TPR repeat protein